MSKIFDFNCEFETVAGFHLTEEEHDEFVNWLDEIYREEEEIMREYPYAW